MTIKNKTIHFKILKKYKFIMEDNLTERQSQMSFHNESKYIDPECFNDDLEEVLIKKLTYF